MKEIAEKKQYKWILPRALTAILLYLVISIMGFKWIMSNSGSVGASFGFVTLVMLLFVSVCMATERGDWNIFIRIVFIPTMWLVNSVLSIVMIIPAFFLFKLLPIENNYFIDLIGLLISGLLIIAFSMRRSKLFSIDK
jgi:hypothetical protein